MARKRLEEPACGVSIITDYSIQMGLHESTRFSSYDIYIYIAPEPQRIVVVVANDHSEAGQEHVRTRSVPTRGPYHP